MSDKPFGFDYTRTDNCLHERFENGVNTFGIYLSPACDFDDEELNEALFQWVCHDSDVEINFRFTVSECLEELIDGHRLFGHEDVVMFEETRPQVDALRAELVAMIATIDRIKFVSPP